MGPITMASVLGGLKKILPFILLAVAILWYSNRLYDKGEAAATHRFDAIQAEAKLRQAAITKKLDDNAAAQKKYLDTRLSEIDRVRTETHTTLIKEIEATPRLQDPEQGITQPMLDAINKARAETRK